MQDEEGRDEADGYQASDQYQPDDGYSLADIVAEVKDLQTKSTASFEIEDKSPKWQECRERHVKQLWLVLPVDAKRYVKTTQTVHNRALKAILVALRVIPRPSTKEISSLGLEEWKHVTTNNDENYIAFATKKSLTVHFYPFAVTKQSPLHRKFLALKRRLKSALIRFLT